MLKAVLAQASCSLNEDTIVFLYYPCFLSASATQYCDIRWWPHSWLLCWCWFFWNWHDGYLPSVIMQISLQSHRYEVVWLSSWAPCILDLQALARFTAVTNKYSLEKHTVSLLLCPNLILVYLDSKKVLYVFMFSFCLLSFVCFIQMEIVNQRWETQLIVSTFRKGIQSPF